MDDTLRVREGHRLADALEEPQPLGQIRHARGDPRAASVP